MQTAIENIQQSVIGTLLISPEKYLEHERKLSNKIFSDDQVLIVNEIKKQYSQSVECDVSILAAQNPAVGIEGFSNWMSNCKIKNFEKHLEILHNAYANSVYFDLQKCLSRGMLENMPPEALRSSVMTHLEKLDEEHINETKHIRELKIEVLNQISKAIESKASLKLTGIDTGYDSLNAITGGWQNPDLILLAGRAGMGKSTMMFNLIRNNLIANEPIAIFSLEMDNEQVTKALISAEAKIPIEYMRTGNLNDDEFKRIEGATQIISEYPLYTQDSIFDLHSLLNEIRVLKRKHDIQAVYIDYLQLIDIFGKRISMYERVTIVSRALKMIAKELKIVVVALCQLSRDVEKRGGDKKPMLSDLKESGALEQDADIVAFVYRPSYYGLIDESGGEDITELIIAKHRAGRCATIEMVFDNGRVSEKEAEFYQNNWNLDPFTGSEDVIKPTSTDNDEFLPF